MKIKITDTAAVEKILQEKQIRCTARVKTYDDIIGLANAAELELDRLDLPKSLLSGATITSGNRKFPGAYKYPPVGTIISLLRGEKSWFLVSCERSTCNRPSENGLRLSDGQLSYLKATLDRKFGK